MKHSRPARAHESGAAMKPEPASLGSLFHRRLDRDLIVLSDDWLRESGVQQQLEFEGFQLRWVATDRLDVNFIEGWQYVTVSYYLWWQRRVRRRHGRETQYLLKRGKSFRSRGTGY